MYDKSKQYFSNISWVGAESAPHFHYLGAKSATIYHKWWVQGKNPLLEQHESDMLSIQKLLDFLGDEANGYRRCYKKYRKEAGMTQEEMANRLGVTTPAVNKKKNFLKDSEMRKNSATWQDVNRGRN